MHWLGFARTPYPSMPFGSARVWNNGVDWAQLQPFSSTPLSGSNPVVQRLDAIVAQFHDHGVRPLIVMGMTPSWAADHCAHGSWPVQTCAPRSTSRSSAWGRYVSFLAHRYHGVDFEVWNEPNLKNGWNDSIAKLAAMQATAYTIIHRAASGARLVSPTVADTAGSPLRWLETFLRSPGGRRFDVLGLHLYPSDGSVRQGVGPEWAAGQLAVYRRLLQSAGLHAPIWNTEVNVGRAEYRSSRTFTGLAGAAVVARTYVLGLASGLQRIYWYAADDRTWGGTWMENADESTLTDAGRAEAAAFHLLVGAHPHGCTATAAHGATRHRCTFLLRNGNGLTAEWTTGGVIHDMTPPGARAVYDVLGHRQIVRSERRLTLSSAPQYVVRSPVP